MAGKISKYFEPNRSAAVGQQVGEVGEALNRLHEELTEGLSSKAATGSYDSTIEGLRADIGKRVDQKGYDSTVEGLRKDVGKKVDQANYDQDKRAVLDKLGTKADASDVDGLRTNLGELKTDLGTRIGIDQYGQDREDDSRRYLARDSAVDVLHELVDVMGTLASRLGDDEAVKAVEKAKAYVERRFPLEEAAPKAKTTKRKNK